MSFLQLNMFPELADVILPVFESGGVSMDVEIQQRSVEYKSFSECENKNLVVCFDGCVWYFEEDSVVH